MLLGTPTIWNMSLVTARARGLKHLIPQYSTVNEALVDPLLFPELPSNSNAGMQVAEDYDNTLDTEKLKMYLFCIGNGGLSTINGGLSGVVINVPKPHACTDAALYHQIPFVVRPITNDLTGADRRRYRLRRTLEIEGELYAAYFGRVLPMAAGSVDMVLEMTPSGQPSSTSTFLPTVNNIRLTDPDVSGNNSITTIRASYVESIEFTAQDVTWLEDACSLLYGNPAYARISEIAVCTGVDKPVIGSYGPNGTGYQAVTNGYNEAVGVQVATFNCTEIVAYGTNGFTIDSDTGSGETLFARSE